MVDLFCQFFLSRETRKLMDMVMLEYSSSGVMFTWPTHVDRHRTFFIWNLMVERTSSTLPSMASLWPMGDGNLPALARPGPRITGDQLDQRLRCKEGIVTLSQFLDKLLVLVELLEVVLVHAGQVVGLGLVAVNLVTQDAHLHLGLGGVPQLDSASKTLVLLGIIVLKGD